MADASRYFYDERYRGRSLLNRLPHGWRESLDQTLSDLCTRGDHPESSWDEYSQELLLSLRADVRDAYLTRHIKFPFYRVAGEEDFWRCLRTQSPFIEQLAREYPHLGVEVLEQLWLERGRGMPSALPSPAEKNGNWLSTNEMSPGFPSPCHRRGSLCGGDYNTSLRDRRVRKGDARNDLVHRTVDRATQLVDCR